MSASSDAAARPAVTVVVRGRPGAALDRSVASVRAQALRAVEVVTGDGRGTGEYVLFLDAGRELDRHACRTLLAALDGTPAAVACAHGPGDDAASRDPSARLYRRSFLEETGTWPADDAGSAALRAAGPDRVVLLPHRLVRPAAAPPERPGQRLHPRVRRGIRLAGVGRALYRRVLRRLPVRRGSVVFESRGGRAYEGGPREVYEVLRASGYRGRMVWAARDGASGFPAGVRVVRRLSLAHYLALARARYWVTDHPLPAHLRKRPETAYLHLPPESPVAYTGLDDPAVKLASRAERRRLRRAAARIDLVAVGSAHDEETLVPALGSSAEVLRTGRPGNDALLDGRAAERAATAARALGVHEKVRVLWAAPAVPDLGPAALAARLGAEFAVLPWEDAVRATDATTALALGDVLVTDASPLVFRHLLLDRPMVLLDPGPPARRTGVYLDLSDEVPGPVVRDLDALTGAVRDRDHARHREARHAFAAKHATYERGDAAAELARRVFAHEPTPPEP
ncbi:CDP-glycerol glycerophosphotransferase family protein [Actinomadura flavalba]|uniref:CDP-glycerol glycerophosphotransferase family protein n=1 Tax=Actinomadura flavalba TaxID=1120938 RepID=UPI0003AA7B64|nr:CDP-glycerol glycerophosphotransferase family protein [Actinomadura flavalba]